MPHLGMEFLGGFRVTLDGAPLNTFESNKVRALLAYLATESKRPHPRESLVALLWPDWPNRSALTNLRNALANLRHVIGDHHADPPYLIISREEIQFNAESDHSLDVAGFIQLGEGEQAERLEQAVLLYKGEFLEGFSVSEAAPFEDWARLKGEQLHWAFLDTLNNLAAALEQRCEMRRALSYARRQVEVEPLDERGYRQVMRLLALNGRRSEALVQYEACRAILKKELRTAPSSETEDLYRLLLKGELSPATVEVQPARRSSREVGACPYRGLAVFREQDAPFYFGREAFIASLEQAVRGRQPLTMIVGSSGSGKSSAVFAGLLPRLRKAGSYQFAIFRPGRQPFFAAAGALLPFLESGLSEIDCLAETRKLAECLMEGRIGLAQVFERILEKAPDSRQILLVIDQFEELYTLCPDARLQKAFVDELLAAMEVANTRRGKFWSMLLTLRADFMNQALSHRPFADVLQEASLLMGPMTRQELRMAIEKPGQLQGAAFEAGLVGRILDDVSDRPGTLPLLEFTLTQLWNQQADGWLTHASYEAMGYVEGALAAYADHVYSELETDEQERVRHALVQLVQPGDGTEDTRRIASHDELGDESWSLIQHLADRRLVVTGRDAQGRETTEVVHEALIQKWGRFREWMEADRAFRAWQERLRVSLRQWLESGKDEGALLGGAPLLVAENMLAERPVELSEIEQVFIRAGVTLREQQAAEREAQRRREQELASRLARQAAILLAGQAETELANGYHDRAVRLALAALENYPYTSQAEHALAQAVSYNRALRQYTSHQSAVTCVAWSPDGGRLASSSSIENRVNIWDAATGETIRVIPMPTGVTQNKEDMTLFVQWTPDGKQLLTVNGDRYRFGSQDYNLFLWEVESGALISRMVIDNQAQMEMGDMGSITNYGTGLAAKIAPGSGRLASLGGDNTALIWEAPWQAPVLALSGHTKSVNSVDWSPDETKLATASLDGTARIWEAHSGQALHKLAGHQGRVNVAVWSPGGSQIATAGSDGVVCLWNALDGQLMRSIQTNAGEIYSLAWAPNNARFVSGHVDGSLRIWETASGKHLETLRGHQGIVSDVKWSPVDDRLASAGGNGSVRIWNLAPSTAWRLYPPQAARGGDWTACGASWASDGRTLAIAGGDMFSSGEPPSFALWNLPENRLFMENLGEALNLNGCWIQFSPDNKTILFLGYGAYPDISEMASVHVFDARTGQIKKTFTPGGEHLVHSIAWSPSGLQLATGLFVGEVLIWDYETGQQIARLIHNPDGVMINSIEWSPDGAKIAASSDNSRVQVWDARTWDPLFTLQHEPPAFATGAAWSPDSTRLLTTAGNEEQGAKDHTARIWDTATGEELLVFHGHPKMVWPGGWSPDGQRVATLSCEGRVRIWDASTGDELLTLSVPVLYGGFTSWSPDGKHLAIFGNKTLVSVWRVWQSTEELVSYAKERCVIRELTEAERKQFALP